MGRRKQEKTVGVYVIGNAETGEIYIGSGKLGDRRTRHFSDLRHGRHVNPDLQAAYNENPKFEFVGIPLAMDEFDGPEALRKKALEMESVLIREQGSNPKLLNRIREVDDSSTCIGHSTDTVEVLSEKLKAKWTDPEWRAKVVAAQNEGRAKMSDEALVQKSALHSASLKRSYETGQRASTAGQTRSDEFKSRASDLVRDLWKDPEWRERQLLARKKRAAQN